MKLSDYLKHEFVVSHLEARDVEGVIGELAARAAAVGVGREETIREKLLERERVHPTVIGSGLAVPHATVPELKAPTIGLALAREPVQFGPPGVEPVRLFFVLLSPPGFEREHVKLLGRICRLVRHEDFIDRLEGAEDEEEILAIVEQVDRQHV